MSVLESFVAVCVTVVACAALMSFIMLPAHLISAKQRTDGQMSNLGFAWIAVSFLVSMTAFMYLVSR